MTLIDDAAGARGPDDRGRPPTPPRCATSRRASRSRAPRRARRRPGGGRAAGPGARRRGGRGHRCAASRAAPACAATARAACWSRSRSPAQERRADLPTIGPDTVRPRPPQARLAGIAVQAGNCLIIERAEVIERRRSRRPVRDRRRRPRLSERRRCSGAQVFVLAGEPSGDMLGGRADRGAARAGRRPSRVLRRRRRAHGASRA